MRQQIWKLATIVAMSMAACSSASFAANGSAAPPVMWSPGEFRGSYLGVDINEITKDRVSALKLKDEHGVEITMVDQDAPAGKAGLKEHDVILEYNGARVEGEEQLKRMIHETPGGRTVNLGISRDGQMLQVPVTLADRRKVTVWGPSGHPMPRILDIPMPPMPPMPEIDMPDVNVLVRSYSISAGMMVDNLTPQLGEFFGVKSGEGVLVRSVEKGSPAEAAGLKAGDVIVKVDDEKVGDRGDWRRALRERKSGKVSLGIVRDKHDQTLTLTLPVPNANDSSKWKEGEFPDIEFDADFDFSGLNGWNDPKVREELQSAIKDAQSQIAKTQTITAKQLRQLRPKIDAEMQKARKQIDEAMRQLNATLESDGK